MRTWLVFLLLFAVAALVAGLLAYPAWTAVQTVAHIPLHRVMNRVGVLALAVATVLWLRARGLANKPSLGYDLPRARFVRQLCIGWLVGVLLMVPLVMVLLRLGIRVATPKLANDPSPAWLVTKLVLRGLSTGLVVALIEETFCRGAMFTAIRKESGVLLAMLLPSLFYAAVHFLGGQLRVPADQVGYLSGLLVTFNLFERFADPLQFADSFAALLALGMLLSLIRWRTNAIAGCIGLHAGGVAVILILRNLTTINPQGSATWMVGSYDGVIGWLACVWIALVAVVYWRASAGKQSTG
jgi:uncharacterized protein